MGTCHSSSRSWSSSRKRKLHKQILEPPMFSYTDHHSSSRYFMQQANQSQICSNHFCHCADFCDFVPQTNVYHEPTPANTLAGGVQNLKLSTSIYNNNHNLDYEASLSSSMSGLNKYYRSRNLISSRARSRPNMLSSSHYSLPYEDNKFSGKPVNNINNYAQQLYYDRNNGTPNYDYATNWYSMNTDEGDQWLPQKHAQRHQYKSGTNSNSSYQNSISDNIATTSIQNSGRRIRHLSTTTTTAAVAQKQMTRYNHHRLKSINSSNVNRRRGRIIGKRKIVKRFHGLSTGPPTTTRKLNLSSSSNS